MRRIALIATAVLTLAACSGTGTNDPAGAEDGQPDANDSDSTGDDEPESPLAEYLGDSVSFGSQGGGMSVSASGGPGQSEEQRQQQQQVESAIADCMADKGFDYVPRVRTDEDGPPFADAFALPPDEFAQEYGYGITTLMTLIEEGETDQNDPNREIREALSPTAREAYDQALWGEGVEVADGGGIVLRGSSGDGETVESVGVGGCQGEVMEEVFGDGPAGLPAIESFNSLFEDLAELRQRVDRDPRLAAAAAAWADCMADEGYPDFDRPGAPEQWILERQFELSGADEPGNIGAEGEAATMLTPEGSGAVDPDALAELRDLEIELATADYACQQEHYAEVYRDVSHEYEADFVEQNRDALERFRDSMAQNPGQG